MRKICWALLIVLPMMGVVAVLVAAQSRRHSSEPYKRASPPQFDRIAAGIFFNDVSKEALSGKRPADLGRAAKPLVGGAGTTGGESIASAAWSQIIDRETIEDEIKSLKLAIDKAVTTPSDFAGRGHKLARAHFTICAIMFGIAGEYDAEVRWKKDAPAARDAFSRAAANAKAGGNTQVYQEAKLRKADLQDLVGGGSFQAASPSQAKAEWAEVCARSQLMKRLEAAQQDKLQPWTANEGDFQRHLEAVVHEAQMVAALAEILLQEGMEDSDDDDYAAFCKQMKQSAVDALEAVKLDNYNQVRKSISSMGQACSQCHELYRG